LLATAIKGGFSDQNTSHETRRSSNIDSAPAAAASPATELELEPIQTQMTQKPLLRAEVGMRVR